MKFDLAATIRSLSSKIKSDTVFVELQRGSFNNYVIQIYDVPGERERETMCWKMEN